MSLKIYDNGGATMDRYTIILNGSVYTMSCDATSANGVNMYAGEITDGDFTDGQELDGQDMLPLAVCRAILDRALFDQESE